MKELWICPKKVHFKFGNVIKAHDNGVALGPPLGPVLSDIFITELETSHLPELNDYKQFSKRYVDDTICYKRFGWVNHILSVDVSVKFIYELEHYSKLPLDMLLCWTGKKTYATVYRKATNNDVYLNCTN